MKHEVIAHTKTGESIRGVLWRKRPAWVIIKQPELLNGNSQPQALEGDVWVHRDNLDFLQVTA